MEILTCTPKEILCTYEVDMQSAKTWISLQTYSLIQPLIYDCLDEASVDPGRLANAQITISEG